MPGRSFGVLLVAATLVVAACGPQSSPGPTVESPTGSEGPSGLESAPAGSPTSSPALSPSAVPSHGPAALALQANIAATVVVDSLNVRQWPGTAAARVGSLSRGDIVILLGYGGIKAGGYVWFEAGRLKGVHGQLPALPVDPTAGGSWTDLTGWIAVGTASTAYVAPLPPRCSTAAATDLGLLSGMLPGEQLACLGRTALVLKGTFGCGGCGGSYPGTFKPTWLATPSLGFLTVDVTKGVGPTALWFPPGVTPPAAGKIVQVRAHLDDARAAGCSIAIPTSAAFDAPPVAIRPADAVLDCRQHIVVDSYQVLGTDPNFKLS